jgi:hypothetical protein
MDEREELIIVNSYEGENQITDHGNNQSGHNLMPQMQYNSGPGSMMQETPRE